MRLLSLPIILKSPGKPLFSLVFLKILMGVKPRPHHNCF
jgi:hypothetical protein